MNTNENTKLFMNIFTGSVDTEENWLSEIESTENLVEVVKDENGDWIEV